MKTTLIQLDENDDILSIKDKMQWNPSRRVLLIVPHNNKCIHRRIDLVLLQRVAHKNGAQLAISTSQKYLHDLGKLTSVKIFSTVLAAQKQDWPDSPHWIRKPESLSRSEIGRHKEYVANGKKEVQIPNWQKIFFFTLGTLAPIALVLVLIPHATITLYPRLAVQKLFLKFSSSPTYLSTSVEGRIPAFTQSLTLSAIDTISTTGETSIPDQFASGTVRIMNLTETSFFLPAHLRLNTNNSTNLQFQTLEAGNALAGVGQFIDVPVTALTAGEAGNLPPLSINSVAEPYGSMLQVTNLSSTTGGTDIKVKAVRENDVQLLKSRLLHMLQTEVLSKTKTTSSSEELFILESMEVVNETETTNLAIGDPSDQLTMEMTETYQFLVIKKDDLKQLVSTCAILSIPQGYQQVAGSLHYEDPIITSFNAENQLILGHIGMVQSIHIVINNNGIVSAILGKTRRQAMNIIESNISMDQPMTITLSPSFWFWMPLTPGQIVLQNSGVK